MGVFEWFVEWVTPSRGRPVAVSSELLESCLQASAESHPDEFLCLLTGERGYGEYASDEVVLTDFYVIPGTKSSPNRAVLESNNVPVGLSVYGSLHSHPNGVLQPSTEDLQLFSKYPVNIIVGSPYNSSDWTAFSSQGEELSSFPSVE